MANAADLEIVELNLYPIREPVSKRAYTVLRAQTKNGLTGFGEGPLTPEVEFAAARQFWTGRQASAYMAQAPPNPLSGAVDIALLDILARSANAPVFRLLGGPTRNKVRAFTSLAEPARLDRALAAGFRAVGVSVPPPAARNQGQAYQRQVRRIIEALGQTDFVLEGYAVLTPGDAASVATTIEPFHPLWFDEPAPVTNLQALHKIAGESVVPLGFGRDVRDPVLFQQLLRESLIDVVRPGLARDGITRIRRIAAMAETYYVAVAPRHGGGPIATAAALQLAAALPNFFIQHIPLATAPEDAALRREIAGEIEKVQDGFAALPATPGLGIAVNEKALEKYHAA
jgi:galactonate dehydratase